MGTFRLIGLFAIIPATAFLTISFFVLFTLRKTETQGLKAFGYVVAALLWVSALMIFSVGVYTLSTGKHPMVYMMHQMMGARMQEMTPEKMQGMMQEGRMPMQHKHTGGSMMK